MPTARSLRRACAAALALAATTLGSAPALASSRTGPGPDSGAGSLAAAYCTSTGGKAALMYPFSGMNNDPSQWMPYGGQVRACTYKAADRSEITLWQTTLYSTEPTMAALAYYAEVPPSGSGGGGDPSVAYCNQLGGAWQIGNGADGGGWATHPGARAYAMCVFADGSAIDTWGLMYHSAGIIRGIDLSTVLKFASPY